MSFREQAARLAIAATDKHSINVGVSYALGSHFFDPGTTLDLIAAGQALVFAGGETADHPFRGQVYSTTFGISLGY